MEIITKKISFRTAGKGEMLDLTLRVQELLDATSLEEGSVLLFVKGSTAALSTVEYEEGLLEDIGKFLEKLLPGSGSYAHDRRWHDGNGHSHLRATLFQPHLAIPFLDGRLELGPWQQVLFLEFDNKPHLREVVAQFTGR